MYHVGAGLSCEVVQLNTGDLVMNTLLNLMHDDVEVHELKVQPKGQRLKPLPDDGDVKRLERALPGDHLKGRAFEGAHSNIIAFHLPHLN